MAEAIVVCLILVLSIGAGILSGFLLDGRQYARPEPREADSRLAESVAAILQVVSRLAATVTEHEQVVRNLGVGLRPDMSGASITHADLVRLIQRVIQANQEVQLRVSSTSLELQKHVHRSHDGTLERNGVINDAVMRSRTPRNRMPAIDVEGRECTLSAGSQAAVRAADAKTHAEIPRDRPPCHRLPGASVWIAEAFGSAWQATTEFMEVNDVEIWTDGFRFTVSVHPSSERLVARFGKDPIMVMAAEVEGARTFQVGDATLYRVTCRFICRLPRTMGSERSPAAAI